MFRYSQILVWSFNQVSLTCFIAVTMTVVLFLLLNCTVQHLWKTFSALHRTGDVFKRSIRLRLRWSQRDRRKWSGLMTKVFSEDNEASAGSLQASLWLRLLLAVINVIVILECSSCSGIFKRASFSILCFDLKMVNDASELTDVELIFLLKFSLFLLNGNRNWWVLLLWVNIVNDETIRWVLEDHRRTMRVSAISLWVWKMSQMKNQSWEKILENY